MSSNDAMLSHTVEMIAKETRLAGNHLVRYKQGQMGHWLWQYKYLPGKTTYVFDGGLGRNDLKALYSADNEMNYLAPSDNGGQVAYTVRFAIGSWRERIVFRSGDFWAYEVFFELIQTQ
jgi:hypothetical protein